MPLHPDEIQLYKTTSCTHIVKTRDDWKWGGDFPRYEPARAMPDGSLSEYEDDKSTFMIEPGSYEVSSSRSEFDNIYPIEETKREMPMKIQLSTAALNALFPDGSDIRIELQNAVIANFVKKITPSYINEEMREAIKSVIKDIFTEEMKCSFNEGTKKAVEEYFEINWSGIRLENKAKDKIKDEVERIVSRSIHSEARAILDGLYNDSVSRVVENATKMMPEYLTMLDRATYQKDVRDAAQKLLNEAISKSGE